MLKPFKLINPINCKLLTLDRSERLVNYYEIFTHEFFGGDWNPEFYRRQKTPLRRYAERVSSLQSWHEKLYCSSLLFCAIQLKLCSNAITRRYLSYVCTLISRTQGFIAPLAKHKDCENYQNIELYRRKIFGVLKFLFNCFQSIFQSNLSNAISLSHCHIACFYEGKASTDYKLYFFAYRKTF